MTPLVVNGAGSSRAGAVGADRSAACALAAFEIRATAAIALPATAPKLRRVTSEARGRSIGPWLRLILQTALRNGYNQNKMKNDIDWDKQFQECRQVGTVRYGCLDIELYWDRVRCGFHGLVWRREELLCRTPLATDDLQAIASGVEAAQQYYDELTP